MKRLVLLLLVVVGCRESVDVARTARAGAPAFVAPMEAPDLDPAPNVVHVLLRAAALVDGGPYLYAYEGSNPGPTIRAKVGDVVVVDLINDLTTPTTIHWHGLAVPFDMDGVTWMRDPVMPSANFEYRFRVNRAGTFWYHPHFDTDRQVEGGLYGALIVEDPADPVPDLDVVMIVDAAEENRTGDRRHGHGKKAVAFRVNGVLQPTLRAAGGSTIRARIVNASNAQILAARWPSMRWIGSDQGLLSALATPSRLLIGPGDRADVEFLVGAKDIVIEADPYSLNGGDAWGDPVELLTIAVDTPAPAPAPLAWPFAGGTPTADPGYADIVYAFAGSDRTGRWMINGEVFPNVTIERIPFGSTAIIDVYNLSPSEHPFHVHGLDFEVLTTNGVPSKVRTIEDTFTLKVRDKVRLRLEANNPGDWMTHCHILPHAEDGMMTVLRVQ